MSLSGHWTGTRGSEEEERVDDLTCRSCVRECVCVSPFSRSHGAVWPFPPGLRSPVPVSVSVSAPFPKIVDPKAS